MSTIYLCSTENLRLHHHKHSRFHCKNTRNTKYFLHHKLELHSQIRLHMHEYSQIFTWKKLILNIFMFSTIFITREENHLIKENVLSWRPSSRHGKVFFDNRTKNSAQIQQICCSESEIEYKLLVFFTKNFLKVLLLARGIQFWQPCWCFPPIFRESSALSPKAVIKRKYFQKNVLKSFLWTRKMRFWQPWRIFWCVPGAGFSEKETFLFQNRLKWQVCWLYNAYQIIFFLECVWFLEWLKNGPVWVHDFAPLL